MKSVIILTGAEPRHTFLRKAIALSGACDVTRTYCEGLEQSLEERLKREGAAEYGVQKTHVTARARSERAWVKFAQQHRFAGEYGASVQARIGVALSPSWK